MAQIIVDPRPAEPEQPPPDGEELPPVVLEDIPD